MAKAAPKVELLSMRKALLIAGALALAGCNSTPNGKVTYREDGTRVYGLTAQPQSAATAQGPLNTDTYNSRSMPGQFTGQEGTASRIGQYETPPPRSDARDLTPPPVGSGIVPPANPGGAGTLGQSGIAPGRSVSSSTILSSPSNPSLTPSIATANPPTMTTAPTLAEPLTRNANVDTTIGVGRGPGAETGSSGTLRNNLPYPALSTPSAALSTGPGQIPERSLAGPATTDLSTRVKEILQSGRPGSISTLTPERLQNLEVESINGNVTLRGTARSETEKLMIENKVAAIPGVASVNNQLRVLTPGSENSNFLSQPEQRAPVLNREK